LVDLWWLLCLWVDFFFVLVLAMLEPESAGAGVASGVAGAAGAGEAGAAV
jgi:hypothetical protein